MVPGLIDAAELCTVEEVASATEGSSATEGAATNGGVGYGGSHCGGQPQMQYGQQQPIYAQQSRPGGCLGKLKVQYLS